MIDKLTPLQTDEFARLNECDPPRLPLLITGIAGVTAYNAFPYFRNRYGNQVIGERRRNHWPLSAPGIVGCDLDDEDDVRRLFDKHQFRAVLSCGGSCALKSCELDPDMAYRVNVQCVRNLVKAVKEHGTRLVHLSIDLVFSGVGDGGYRETDSVDPVTVYGKTMAEAEQLILAECDQACILRISLPMGVSFNGHAGAIDWIQSRFKQNKPATLYFDEIRTPTYTDCMIPMLEEVIAGNLRGLFHAGGPRRLSLYQIAQVVNRVGGYDPDLLIGCPRIDAGPMPPRAGNVTLDSTQLANALSRNPFTPWPYSSDLVPSHREWHFQRDVHPRGSRHDIHRLLYQNPLRRLRS